MRLGFVFFSMILRKVMVANDRSPFVMSKVAMRAMLIAVMFLLSGACDAAEKPNIVLIVSDDQGYNDLGVLGDHIITPNLDRLAEEGVRLTNFYVTWPACTPSRGSFLTGRYPQRNGMYDMIRNEAPDYGHKYTPEEYAVTWERIGGMDTREVHLPQVLKQAGYYCGIFGKWDLGKSRRFLPLQRGWDEFYGFSNSGIDYYTHERYGMPSMYDGNSLTTKDQGTYSTDLFRREAVRFLVENRDRPFFLYLAFNAPHNASNLDPKIRLAAQAPERWRKMYPELHKKEKFIDGKKYDKPAKVPNRSLRLAHYRGAVTAMDAAIGDVLDLLEEYKLAENTIVVFFSDNGGCSISDNSPLRGHKGMVFEGGIRVCCLARYPGHIAPGTVNDEFLTSLELFPTLMNVAGAAPPKDAKGKKVILDGFDMMPMLAKGEPSPRKAMFWKRRGLEAARIGVWKWINKKGRHYLFNLADDPGEKKDLSKSMPEKTREMENHFQNWLAEMNAAEPRGPFKDF